MFSQYLSTLPRTIVTEAITSLYGVLLEASEGEAGKYFRKTIRSASPEIIRKLHEDTVQVMKRERPEAATEYWIQWLWNWFRQDFALRNNEAVYFAPGLARIVLCQPDSEELFEYYPLDALSRNAIMMKDLVHYITLAHKDNYTRYLVDKKTGQPATFASLVDKFGAALKKQGEEVMANLETLEYTPSDYVIVELKDFDTANQFAEYTELNDIDEDDDDYDDSEHNRWCYLEDEETYDYYRQDGIIRCYLAYKPGFENLRPGDKGYGQSMLGIDIGPGNRLVHCNNRYNHEDDPELDNDKNPPGDDRFNATELSQLLGGPYYKFCPYYNAEERKQLNIYTTDDIEEALSNGESIADMVTPEHKMDNGDTIISLHKHLFNVLSADNRLLLSKWVDTIKPISFKGKPHYLVEYRDHENIFNTDGHPVLDKWYDRVRQMQDGHLEVRDGNLQNILDVSGKFVFRNWYYHTPEHLKGNIYSAYMEDGKVHFIDNNEKELTDLVVDSISRMDDDFSCIRKNSKLNILRNDTLQPVLDPWFDDITSLQPDELHVDKVKLNTEDRGYVFNYLDSDRPDHYLLDEWCDDDFLCSDNRNLLRVMYYDHTTKERTYNLLNLTTKKTLFKQPVEWVTVGKERVHVHKDHDKLHQLTDFEGNPLFDDWVEDYEVDDKNNGIWLTKNGKRNFSHKDKSLALEQWYDIVYHGLVPGDYVVGVKTDDSKKYNIIRNGNALLAQWADDINSSRDQYYILKYGEQYTVADQDGHILLDEMYDYIRDIYDGNRIVVGKRDGNNFKYTICQDGKPMLDGWYDIDNGWGYKGDAIDIWPNCVIVQINKKYNVLLNSGKWLFDQWYDLIVEREAPLLCFVVKSNGKYNVWNKDHFEFDQWYDKANWPVQGSAATYLSNDTESIEAYPNYDVPGGPMKIKHFKK